MADQVRTNPSTENIYPQETEPVEEDYGFEEVEEEAELEGSSEVSEDGFALDDGESLESVEQGNVPLTKESLRARLEELYHSFKEQLSKEDWKEFVVEFNKIWRGATASNVSYSTLSELNLATAELEANYIEILTASQEPAEDELDLAVEPTEPELAEDEAADTAEEVADTAPTRSEDGKDYYENEAGVSLRASFEGGKRSFIRTQGTTDIYAQNADRVEITKQADGSYQVIAYQGKFSHRFTVNAASINLHADVTKTTFNGENYYAGLDPKIHMDGEESAKPSFDTIPMIQRLQALLPEKGAEDIFNLINEKLGDLIPSEYKGEDGLTLQGLKQAIQDGAFPPPDPVRLGDRLITFFTEIDPGLAKQYEENASTKGWRKVEWITDRVVEFLNALGYEAEDVYNSRTTGKVYGTNDWDDLTHDFDEKLDNIRVRVNGEWQTVDIVGGKDSGYKPQFSE